LPVAVKIAVPFALITLATSALLAAYASGSARRQLQSGYDAQLRQVQNAVQVVFATNANNPQQVNALLQRIKASDDLVLVASVFRPGPPPTSAIARRPTRSRRCAPVRSSIVAFRWQGRRCR
jgi:hypothetical protein